MHFSIKVNIMKSEKIVSEREAQRIIHIQLCLKAVLTSNDMLLIIVMWQTTDSIINAKFCATYL
jgi:hypothetical protein